MSSDHRKADTRHKIELGGLRIKAGLGDLDKAVLYGIDIDARERINGPNGAAEIERFRKIGSDGFNASKT
jgi:hypothetical protein